MSVLPELLLIDKPKGISSFTVIRQLRRLTGVRKMGHAGTLDPLASGLMLIGVEKGTKKLTGLVGLDKEYVASILLGEQRSTGDMEGEILAERSYAGDVSKEAVLEALRALEGEVGRLLGYPAVMSDLRRTKVGEYRIEDAKRLEEFDTLAQRLLNKLKFW